MGIVGWLVVTTLVTMFHGKEVCFPPGVLYFPEDEPWQTLPGPAGALPTARSTDGAQVLVFDNRHIGLENQTGELLWYGFDTNGRVWVRDIEECQWRSWEPGNRVLGRATAGNVIKVSQDDYIGVRRVNIRGE